MLLNERDPLLHVFTSCIPKQYTGTSFTQVTDLLNSSTSPVLPDPLDTDVGQVQRLKSNQTSWSDPMENVWY